MKRLEVEMEQLENVRDYLRTWMEKRYGGPSKAADALKFSKSQLSESMSASGRQLPGKLLDAADVVLFKGGYYLVTKYVVSP